jgi:hypothetical protein
VTGLSAKPVVEQSPEPSPAKKGGLFKRMKSNIKGMDKVE